MRALVVAAHPDDEVLGCGATVARLAAEGAEVTVAILGEGVTSRYDQREMADRSLVEELHGRSQRAVALLGVSRFVNCQLPDNRFDTVPLLDIVKLVEGVVQSAQPDLVLTHQGGDLNIDHVITHRAVLTATRPMAGCTVRELLAFEIPSSTEWSFDQFAPGFRPNVFVDISTTLDRKLEAMAAYESEARAFPHPRSYEALQAIARRWGSVAGVMAAEAFELIRRVD